jgi:glycosyltransferase involved in cell wall biosynthesis
MSDKKLLSIVIPVFNEDQNIDPMFDALDPVLQDLSSRYAFELLFTDNHSTDGTFARLQRRATIDPRVRVLRFSRNFGYQRSIYTGFMNARGAAAIQFDVDLQDPPAMIAEFVRRWENGAEVVYGIRQQRDESRLMEATRRIFYHLINWLSDNELPVNAGDFRLIDRKILDLLSLTQHQQPYLRGIIANFGFRQVGIPYKRAARARGESKFRLGQYFQLAIDGIASQSVVPLRLATYTGLLISLATILGIFGYTIGHFLFGAEWPPGFATTTILILTGISLNAMFLGIIGEYLARIYRQSMPEPLTIIEASIPLEDTAEKPRRG